MSSIEKALKQAEESLRSASDLEGEDAQLEAQLGIGWALVAIARQLYQGSTLVVQ